MSEWRISESTPGITEMDVPVVRKLLGEPLAVQPVDLPVFSLRCDAVTYMRINQC